MDASKARLETNTIINNTSRFKNNLKQQQQQHRKMVHEFSHFKSKCICCCCSQTSNCLSWNRIDLFDSNENDELNDQINEPNECIGSEYTCERSIQFRRFRRFFFRNYVYTLFNPSKAYLFRRKRLKLKLTSLILVLIFLIYIISLLSNHLKILNDLRKQNSQVYDLMSDALRRQNISRHMISCVNSNRTDVVDRLADKYILFRDYYHFETRNDNDREETASYSLNYTLYLQPDISSHLAAFINSLKLCSIRSFNNRFESNLYDFGNFDLFESLKERKPIKELEMFSNLKLKPGGFYQSPLCVQEFFYSYSHWQALDVIRSFLNQTKPINVNEMVRDVAKSTYRFVEDILKQHMFNLNEYIQLKSSYTLIIIPYLNRKSNLLNLMANLHPFLQRQFINYFVMVAEQVNSKDPFNKGRIYNAAFDYVENHYNVYSSFLERHDKLRVNCVILHDVDLVPESDYNMYGCDYSTDAPRHLSLSIRFDSSLTVTSTSTSTSTKIDSNITSSPQMTTFPPFYKKNLYELLVGGVLCIKPHIFKFINGFSNEYWLWGGEDDDIGMRMIAKNVCINRPRHENALFRMLNHTKSEKNPVRENLLFSSVVRMNSDGLSNINQVNVSVVEVRHYDILTHLRIFTGQPSSNYFEKYSKFKQT